jgi:hypothetical protein
VSNASDVLAGSGLFFFCVCENLIKWTAQHSAGESGNCLVWLILARIYIKRKEMQNNVRVPCIAIDMSLSQFLV